MREELQFKNHKLSEWENLLLVERNNTKTLEDELEVMMVVACHSANKKQGRDV